MPDFQFQYILLLLLLLLVPIMAIMYWMALRKKKRSFKKIGDPELVQQLLGPYQSRSFFKKFILLTAAMTALVLGIANLRIPTGSQKVSRSGIDVMIALDVSKSMLAQDIKPNRLERARQLLGRLIDRLGNDRVGIVIFAGKAYLQMPLTGDLAAAKMYLSSASTGSVPTQGTVIGDALKMCYASFNNKEKKYKAVVLISDGEDHDETAAKTAQQMADEGVSIYTVGIGSPGGATIEDEATGQLKMDENGNTVITRLNEEELKEIAVKGNGSYQLFTNTETVVNNLDAQLSTMDQRTVKDDSLINYKSFYQVFLALALLLLLIELLTPEMIRKKIKPAKLVTTLFFAVFFSSSFAQGEKAIIKEGNDAYKNNEFAKAEDSYGKVLQENPGNTIAQYNMGNALYKNGKADEAIAAYDRSISQLSKPVEKSNAYHNKGVVLQNNKKIPECIEAYKNALKLDPNNEDARQNLQKALQQQKEQQQQDQKDKDKKDSESNPDKNKDQQQQPKPQQSKLTKQDAEEKLKALMQKEKNLQDKLRKVSVASPDKPEKDW
jgi:tetratricopeptide (TPR) repeat protein